MARGRKDILKVGLEIYQEILATIGGEGMIISDAGLLEGILLSLLETDLAVRHLRHE
jgi:exopolyphosphatase/pppGpp-phosphohydrolase